MGKWIGGLLGTVLAGVLIWWLTVGVHDTVRKPPQSEPQPPAAAGGPTVAASTQAAAPSTPPGVGACSAGAKPDDNFHDTAAANGSWDWNCNGQAERQYGTCEALTKEQCDPNTNATHAPPGFCAQVRGPAGCTPTVAACGASGQLYPCFYNPADGRCHAGGYETAAVMRCK